MKPYPRRSGSLSNRLAFVALVCGAALSIVGCEKRAGGDLNQTNARSHSGAANSSAGPAGGRNTVTAAQGGETEALKARLDSLKSSEGGDYGKMMTDFKKALSSADRNAVQGLANELVVGKLTYMDKLLLAILIENVAEYSPARALDLLAKSVSHSNMQQPNGLFDIVAKADPELLVTRLLEIPKKDRDSEMFARALSSLHDKPETVIRFLKGMSDPEKKSLFNLGIGIIASEDPENTVRLIGLEFKGDENTQALGIVAAKFGLAGDVTKCVSMLEALGKSKSADQAFVDAVTSIAFGSEPNDAFTILEKCSPAAVNSLLVRDQAMSFLIKGSPEGVLELLGRTVPTASNLSGLSKMVGQLITTSPDKTLGWISSQPEGASRSGLLNEAFSEWVKTDPDAALLRAGQMPAADQSASLRGIVKAMANTDYDRSLQVAANASPANQQNMYREIARAVTYSSPDQAVAILDDPSMTSRLGTDFRSEMLDHTVRVWAKQDLESARTWVEKLPVNDQANGVRGLMNPWMKSDPVAASQWLANLPVGPIRDAGAKVVIEQVKDTDPEMAEQWRKSLTPHASGKN